MENNTAPSLQDAQLLTSSENVTMPLTITSGRYTLLNHQLVLFYSGLGSAHAMTNELHAFVLEYDSHEPQLENYQPPPPVQKAHVPALAIVRWVQLRISRWIDRQLLLDTPVPAPQLTALFDTMFVGDHWAPSLPPAYWEAAYPQQQQ
jgi:hypothetical protein